MTGRPSIFSDELAAEICRRLANGESLRSICNDDAMPHRDTVRVWQNEKPSFSAQYARARLEGADVLFDDLIQLADDNETGDVQHTKLRVDTRKWALSKMRPDRYGDKVENTIKGDPAAPIVHEHTFAAPATPEKRAMLTAAVRDAICGGEG